MKGFSNSTFLWMHTDIQLGIFKAIKTIRVKPTNGIGDFFKLPSEIQSHVLEVSNPIQCMCKFNVKMAAVQDLT